MFRKHITSLHAQCRRRRHYGTTALKQGFVKLVDVMPSRYKSTKLKCDEAIVQAARISYDGHHDVLTDAQDARLINYLMRHNHSSPLEMVEFKFHVRAPIFVLRQWFRHRTFSYNEISARYTRVTTDTSRVDTVYVPEVVRVQSDNNAQSSEGQHTDPDVVARFQVACCADAALDTYERSLEEGVPREQARMVLPQNMMSEIFVKGNLKNWLHFIRLRTSPGAQHEIRVYADQIASHVKDHCPVSYRAFETYQLHAITFSKKEQRALADVVETALDKRTLMSWAAKSPHLKSGERRELMAKLKQWSGRKSR